MTGARRDMRLAAGVDFGSDSVRVSVVDSNTGESLGSASAGYSSWAEGKYCDPQRRQFRQHPLDYLRALDQCFSRLCEQVDLRLVSGIGIDTTGSTPAPVNREGLPLALLPEFSEDPDCMFWLWKDQTATAEAVQISRTLSQQIPDHTSLQGEYSPEWWWAKILHGHQISPAIKKHALSWIEHSDWLANYLVGHSDPSSIARNRCAAGHKATLGGDVPEEQLRQIHPYLASVRRTLSRKVAAAGTPIGTISPQWAARLGLDRNTIVSVGSLDAHSGGVGVGIGPGTLVKIIGTSTVDLFIAHENEMTGIDLGEVGGLAHDSIIPGFIGGESGQAAFGDLFAWFADIVTWGHDGITSGLSVDSGDLTTRQAALTHGRVLQELDRRAAEREPSEILALDWLNGRRYPNPDPYANAALTNLRIGSDAVDLYKALVESVAMGSKAIFQGLREAGLSFERVILGGGIARKSPYVCQTISDALKVEVMVSQEEEACALGAAMYASVAAGHHKSLADAQSAMSAPFKVDYRPRTAESARLDQLLENYKKTGTALQSGLH